MLGGAAAVWPLAARAQQPAMPVLGYLSSARDDLLGRQSAFLKGLSETCFVEGRSIAIEYRFAENQLDRLLAFRRPVNVLAAGGVPAAVAANAATTTIPIAFFVAGDPVKLGLVTSMNRPDGNLTGVTSLGAELSAKRLELAREVVPKGAGVALLVNPDNANTAIIIKDAQTATGSLGLQLHILRATSAIDIDANFATLAQRGAAALVVGNDGLFMNEAARIAALSIRHAVPAIFQTPDFVSAGGLMAYGASSRDAFRQLGVYTGRILKGEKPGDLPVVQSTKIELIINLKTAKALGLAIPLPLLGRADEVIE
jgi:putative tryptophan/tyrosine transport system substrate-binding protein